MNRLKTLALAAFAASALVLSASADKVYASRAIRPSELWYEIVPLKVSIINPMQIPIPWFGFSEYDDNWGNYSVYGIDVASIWSMSAVVYGIDVGVGMQCSDTLAGVQVGVAGLVAKGYGLQACGISWADETFDGVQIGVWNASDGGAGLQFGVINYSDDFRGVQIGVWNILKRASHPMLPLVNARF